MKKKLIVGAMIVCLALAATATFAADQSRSVSGKILTSDDSPIAQAVVYLKNTKTLAVKTFISDQEGSYRFQNLTPNTDYEIYAESQGKKSSTKTLSAFDTRSTVTLNLHIDMKK